MTRMELLEAARLDPVELERLRKQTLLGFFKLRDIRIPDAEKMSSGALQRIFDAIESGRPKT